MIKKVICVSDPSGNGIKRKSSEYTNCAKARKTIMSDAFRQAKEERFSCIGRLNHIYAEAHNNDCGMILLYEYR